MTKLLYPDLSPYANKLVNVFEDEGQALRSD